MTYIVAQTSVLYELPVGNDKLLNINNRFVNGIVGGWRTGGIVTAACRQP
jgi:hypothetical protein